MAQRHGPARDQAHGALRTSNGQVGIGNAPARPGQRQGQRPGQRPWHGNGQGNGQRPGQGNGQGPRHPGRRNGHAAMPGERLHQSNSTH
jgi:hypothetical protein